MNKKLQNRIFIMVASVISVVFLYLLISKVDGEKTLHAFKSANYLWLVISMLLGIVSYFFRAQRWNILFEPMEIKVKTSSAFWTIAFAYFINLILPRFGEIARATSLYKMEKVPVEKSLGTIVLERIIDLFYLGFFGLLTLLFCPEPFEIFWKLGKSTQSGEKSKLWLYIFLGIVVLIGLLLYIFRNKIKQWKWFHKLKEILHGFKEGFLSILKIKHKFLFFLYSSAIWLCYFLMTFLVIFSFKETENIPWNYGFFLMIAGSVGMIFPATGGLAYPLVMRYAFGAIFVSLGSTLDNGYDAGTYFGISLYLAQIIMVVVFGFISMYYIAKASPKNEIITESELNL